LASWRPRVRGEGRWGRREVAVVHQVAQQSAARARAIAARSFVVRTFTQQALGVAGADR